MRPVREICEKCAARLPLDRLDMNYHRLVDCRLASGCCVFVVGIGGDYLALCSYGKTGMREPKVGEVPEMCPYSAEIAVSQKVER